MTIYLYVKTHTKTGLKYLGKTVRKHPHKYPGSGKHWRRHLNKHGYTYTTEILRECQTNEELKEWGLYYSNLWNVVESKEWANLKPEVGDGGFSEENRIKGQLAHTNESRKKQQESLKKYYQDPTNKQHFIERFNSPEYITKLKAGLRKAWARPEVKEKHTGRNNPSYDHTIYEWHHKDGTIEYLTRNDLEIKYGLDQPNLTALLKGRAKTHGGWRVISAVKNP